MKNIRPIRVRFRGLFFFILIFLPLAYLSGQQINRGNTISRNDLGQFSKIRRQQWKFEKQRADSLARILNMSISYTDDQGRVVILQRLGYRNKPVYYATDNLTAATTIFVDQLWGTGNEYPSLGGTGVDVNIWDGGSILSTHQEFQQAGGSRVLMRDPAAALSSHSTHIAGTIGAAGVNPNARGMAGNVSLFGWDMNNDIAEMAMVAKDGASVSNHSYGPLCGWYYSTSSDKWYWYGDITLSTVEDYEFGFYDQTSADLDYLAWAAPNYLIMKSAGNDRNDAPLVQPVNHYVWNGAWVLVKNVVRDPDGGLDGYDCLSPMSVSKNILTVGAVDDAKSMTLFSAFGPTDDGRIKPDVTANGKDVLSSIGSAIDAYAYYDGTSMAAASVTGAIALVNNLQAIIQPGVKLLSSTVKGLLVHTTDEAGNAPGPDYQYGWGILNLKAACDLIFNNSGGGGERIYEGMVAQGQTVVLPISTSASSPYLKVTICWTDPPGPPSTPSLNSREPKLVNDLDIELENVISGNIHYPWVLDVEHPELPASRGINHIDNVEQIYLANPGSGQFNLKISHSGSLLGGAQQYSLLVSGSDYPSGLFPPVNLKYSGDEASIRLKWDHPQLSTPDGYQVYRNGLLLANVTDTFYYDRDVVADALYEYYVTATYTVNDEKVESMGTNVILAYPRRLRPLPFTEYFEAVPTEVLIKNGAEGWQWGNHESLSCYYLDFSENTTNFIGVDSYSAGELVHITDVAETMPLRLAEYTDVAVSFKYFLNTGIYGAIDELHVVYKLPEDDQWIEWVNLPRALDWTAKSFQLPQGACKNGTQIGFYFDDFYQWGMGAGLDDIEITGTPVRAIDLAITSLASPVSACSLSEGETVSLVITNIGEQAAMPGDVVQIEMIASPGVTATDWLTLTEPLLCNQSITHTMSSTVDLSAEGLYSFEFNILCPIDFNVVNNSWATTVEVFGYPKTEILNSDLSICTSEDPVLIQVSPPGGVLSGSGITGDYFNPAAVGEGAHLVAYTYTSSDGCTASAEALFTVIQNPILDLGPDVAIGLDETIELAPSGDHFSYLWFDGSTQDHISLVAEDFGVGEFDIWLQATNVGSCSTVDSLVLTVYLGSYTDDGDDPEEISVYPNPVTDGFYLKLGESVSLESLTLFGTSGKILLTQKPSTYPYFNLAKYQPGVYMLRLQTQTRIYVVKILKH